MPTLPPELGINLGYKCNFNCAHCAVLEPRGIKLSRIEEDLLASTISQYRFKSVLFVGGEPTLFIPSANRILQKAGDLTKVSVRITTNGYFADTVGAAVRVLSSFVKLDKVLLSYDKYHAKFLPIGHIENLFHACRKLKIKFIVTMAIGSPLDLVLLKKIRQAGRFRVVMQKVLPVGRARINGIAHKYPSFDSGVLEKRCENSRTLMYFCGRGFTTCCSILVYDRNMRGVMHGTPKEHIGSEFYRLMSKLSFRGLAKRLGVSCLEFSPEHSDRCTLCAHLFNLARNRREIL